MSSTKKIIPTVTIPTVAQMRHLLTRLRWVRDQNRATRNACSGKAQIVVSANDDSTLTIRRALHDDDKRCDDWRGLDVDDTHASLTFDPVALSAQIGNDVKAWRDVVALICQGFVGDLVCMTDDQYAASGEAGMSQRDLRDRYEAVLISLASCSTALDPVQAGYFKASNGIVPVVALVESALASGYRPTGKARDKVRAAVKAGKNKAIWSKIDALLSAADASATTDRD